MKAMLAGRFLAMTMLAGLGRGIISGAFSTKDNLMKRPALAVVVFLCLHVVVSAQVANGVQGEQATQTQKAGPPFANTDVICMVKAGLDESTIVLAIEQKPTAAFDTSPDALTELKKTGVSQAIQLRV